MLHYDTISPGTLELLRKIQSLDMFKDARLVGGTALALQLGHRKSVDLDIFGHVDASLQEIVLELSEFASVAPLSESRMMRLIVLILGLITQSLKMVSRSRELLVYLQKCK